MTGLAVQRDTNVVNAAQRGYKLARQYVCKSSELHAGPGILQQPRMVCRALAPAAACFIA